MLNKLHRVAGNKHTIVTVVALFNLYRVVYAYTHPGTMYPGPMLSVWVLLLVCILSYLMLAGNRAGGWIFAGYVGLTGLGGIVLSTMVVIAKQPILGTVIIVLGLYFVYAALRSQAHS
ncbi:MAG: hypothetical protein HZC51_08465 [Nitrospirae bacterium]|nr:hypothetical protein [Nitrospirota bacterium]